MTSNLGEVLAADRSKEVGIPVKSCGRLGYASGKLLRKAASEEKSLRRHQEKANHRLDDGFVCVLREDLRAS